MTLGRQRIPILDIAQHQSNRAAFVEELRVACHTVGFFLIRHDFGPLARRMLEETRSFFAHSLEEKMSISYEDSPSFRGFMRLGVENTSGRVDCREQVEYAVEYPGCNNNDQPKNEWPVYERLKAGKNPWPSRLQPRLESTTRQYSSEVCAVADIIRDSLCLALQLDPAEAIHDKFTGNDDNNQEFPHWVIKLVSYPPAPSSSDNNNNNNNNLPQQGVGAHTDTNFLTLVLQDSSSATGFNGGLQAYSRGEWIDVVVPSSSSSAEANNNDETHAASSERGDADASSSSCYLICNLGEQAETWSRGYFLATPHRVLAKPSSSAKPRTSVPLFYNPVLSATMGPLDDNHDLNVLPWERPEGYDHWRRPNNFLNPSVGDNTFKSLARSHPRVFARHHPDLELLPDGRIVRRVDSSDNAD